MYSPIGLTPTLPQALQRLPEQPPHALPAASVSASARTRTEWVDVAKGIGIVLVVVGHAIGGLLEAKLLGPDSGWAAAFYWVYTFHMPLFFVLAGLFVQERLAVDAGGFVRSAFTRIAWPYLLWSVIQLLVINALGSMVNSPYDLKPWRLVALLWEPMSQFWFLQALLVLHLASRFLLPRIGAAALLLVMLLARGVVEVVDLPTLLRMPASFGLFYALGVVAGPLLLRTAGTLTRPHAWALAMLTAGLWAGAALAAFVDGQGYWSVGALPAALAGSAAVIVLATLPRGALGEIWIALGRASMTIYLLHVLFVAGTRITLNKLLGIDQPELILALAVTFGIAGPLVVRRLALRANVVRVLGLG